MINRPDGRCHGTTERSSVQGFSQEFQGEIAYALPAMKL